ncbi:MAG: PepSY-associated TM helix domain-containing protein, partial [Methylobacter sp.]
MDTAQDSLIESKAKRLQQLKKRRQLWLQVHLYLGLFAGAILVVVGVTGSILVFYQELQEVLNAEQIILAEPSNGQRKLQPMDDIVAAAEQIKPAQSHLVNIYVPRNADAAYKLLYFIKAPGRAEDKNGYYVFVNPYTAQATGKQFWYFRNGRYWGIPFVSFVMQLHYCLLQGAEGETFAGIVSALLLISVLTGIIVWWPLTGKFIAAFSFKSKASAVRFNFDLHKVVGIYSAVILF